MEDAEKNGFIYQFGKFTLDPQEKTLFVEGKAIRLRQKNLKRFSWLKTTGGL